MFWQIQFFPACTHHVFLSHCREDRTWLVAPLYEALRRQGIIPWLDRHDYPYGLTSFEALRDGVLRSRHVVFLVTKGMLTQSRGWSFVELAWANLLQENLQEPGGTPLNVVLPLFFLAQDDERLLRSAWQSIRERARFHRPEDGDEVKWASDQIAAFILRESQRGLDNARWLEGDSRARERLSVRSGLIDRITTLHPAAIAVP